MASRGPGLYEFLIEAELQQYYACLKNDLKVQNASQLKYVSDEDLNQMGMSRPEMRRLKKYFQKHFPQNYISKFKKMILSKKEEQLESMLSMLPEEGVERPPVRVPNKHIIPAEAILVNKELGTGEFGIVQQGVWTNDGHRIQVAIKCLSRERMQSNPIEFLKEAAIMHGIDHEHIVRLYGVVLDTNALMLVTELAPLRSLLECLKEPSLRSSFPVLSLCDFAIQICDGMQYLETKRLIHRDLAARNILVFSKNKVKISDFGLSRALGVGKDYYQTNFNVNLKLPIAWCAPECISYLRFTSASDVWAYGVTLWEMFSYGFQPWAALTGHQILEAIDEPNFQRLEQPECCPKEYFNLMLKCWQHDPNKRPRFADLISLLPECKPEQVQAVQEGGGMGEERLKRDQLVYRASDIITVLDKSPPNAIGNCWKGVLNNGKTGLFNPANTIAYLGSNLPSNKPGEFVRSDGKTNTIYSSRRSRLRPDMISCPQGDFKHTSHVGLDGAYFGDISFLGGSKYNHIPHQVVTPYKPHEDNVDRSCSDKVPLLTTSEHSSSNGAVWNGDPDPIPPTKLLTDHEYHEISDEENVTESPRFEKTFDFGPSLLDEMDAMFKSLDSPSPSRPPPSPLDDTVNKRNELREMAAANNRKKQATVKPISAADERTLDTAIAMANELAARSMDNQLAKGNLPSPSPASPTKRKFSFHFPSSSSSTSASAAAAASAKTHRPQGKTFTDEAASRPDIQTLCTSLRSLSSCTSLESFRSSAPFRLPLWDKASAEFCFARSRDLLTRATPHLDSSLEVLENSESEEITKLSEPLRRCSSNDREGLNCWRLKHPNKLRTDLGHRKYLEGGTKLSSRIMASSIDSSINNSLLSYERAIIKSTSTDSASTLDACPSLSDVNSADSSTLKNVLQTPCNSYDTLCSGMSSGFSTFGKTMPPARVNYEHKFENDLEQNKADIETHYNGSNGYGGESRNGYKGSNGFVDESRNDYNGSTGFMDESRNGYNGNNGFVDESQAAYQKEPFLFIKEDTSDVGLKREHLFDVDGNAENVLYGREERKKKFVDEPFVPSTPMFRRKLATSKPTELLKARSTKSSPSSPSVVQGGHAAHRARTGSLSEQQKQRCASALANRRRSFNFGLRYESSSSDSEYEQSPSQTRVQPRNVYRHSKC
ncbi:activated Cdc42 kinase-like isoform X2 [Nilaparvata lugens]|uniref:activated Cdc42 kinase-like isoform X2 n=1 Tax=Nilaparvata lugens TaxID=108931 RepID=UPI00193DEECE|nr:activated Cdc42 kinase-like isoform X2 [Nilaparvata lugens]